MTAHAAKYDSITWRELAIQAVLCLLVVAVLFPGVFLRGELAVPWSVLYNYSPWEVYAPEGVSPAPNISAVEPIMQMFYWYWQSGQSFEDGEWPLWNPLQFCGMPLLANGQSSTMYPPRLLHHFMDGWVATSLFVLLRVWLCGATAYLCARGMGFGIDASRFLSFGWMLAMFNMVWVFWPNPDTSAWVPVLFLGTELIIRSKLRRGFFTIAFGAACILLTGHLEAAFTVSLGLGIYFCVRLLLERRSGRALFVPLAVALAGWIAALMLSAAQVIPFIEYILNSYTYSSRSGESLAVAQLFFRGLVCFWVPHFFGATVDGNFWGITEESSATFLGNAVGNTNHVSFVYVGIVAWMALSCVIPSLRKDRTIRNRSIALAVAGLVGLLLALNHPLLSFLNRLPLMSATVRTHHASFLLFALVVLGAQGVDQLCRGRVRLRELRLPALLSAAIAVFVLITRFSERDGIILAGVQDYVNEQVLIAFALGGVAWVLIVFLARGRRTKLAATSLVTLLCIDLLLACHGLRSTTSRDAIANQPEIFNMIGRLEPGSRHSVTSADIFPGPSQFGGVEILQGYDAIVPDRFRRFVVNSEQYWGKMEATTGTRYWVFREGRLPDETEKYRKVAAADGYVIYENKERFPRAYLVGAVERVGNAQAVFNRLADSDFDPATSVLTEDDIDETPADAGADVGEAMIIERTGNRVVIEADATRDCVLVLSDTYYPGWRARIDGEPAPIFPANYAFRGVLIPKGQHTIEFEYVPRSFQVGLAISTVTAILAVIAFTVFAGSTARRRRSRTS